MISFEDKSRCYAHGGDAAAPPDLSRCSGRFIEIWFDQLNRFPADARLVTEAVQPVHVRFAAEPGKLALGVVTMALLRERDGVRFTEVAPQKCTGLLITE